MDPQQSGKAHGVVTLTYIKARWVASGVDIKNKNGNLTAPTPQNTPINPAPITSSYRPSIPAISEDSETKGKLVVVIGGWF